jgi:replicative DNA helicase
MANMLEEALEYARRGWWVFPCREKPGAPYIKNGETIIPAEKTPYIAGGLKSASIDENQITAWWTTWKDALIGINAEKSGLFVVDIDKKHVNGLDTYTTWNINDTAGLQSITPSGGMHIIFTGTGKSSTNGKTGIDTRGIGGYFIAPPSKIIEGEYTGEYKRFNDWSNPPGIIPDGLMAKLFPESTLEYVRGSSTPATDGTKKKLSRITRDFMTFGAVEGERNTKLYNAACDFVGCGYTREETKGFLFPIVQKMQLSNSEFEIVLEHAYSKPRTPSIPDSIQEKIMEGGKDVASKITFEEQAIMENAVLACMMLDNTSIPIIQDILNFDDFRVVKNRIIYRTINRMFMSGMRVDHLTVANEVEKETDKVSLDDVSKLTSLYFVNTDNASTYANIIKEKSSLRKLEALLDNKEKYIKGNLIESISSLEKDVSDIALASGAKSTAVLSSSQATEMVTQRTEMMISGKIEQLKIGFSDFDYHVGGIYSDELIMCAARSGDGKSAFMLSILNNVSIVQRKPSIIFSLEMSTHESICRLICQLTGIAYKDVYQGKMSADEWREYRIAMEQIADSPLYFDDGFGMTVPEIRSKVRKLVDKGLVLIGIDQLEQVKGYDGMSVAEQYNKNAYDIKNMCKEFNVPILLNHQLNRNIADRKLKNVQPITADLNQAGEKAPDQVHIILHNRDENNKIMQSKVQIIKNRNGPIIDYPVIFVGSRMLFSNPTKEQAENVKVAFKNKPIEDEYTSDNPYQDAINAQVDNAPWWSKKEAKQ